MNTKKAMGSLVVVLVTVLGWGCTDKDGTTDSSNSAVREFREVEVVGLTAEAHIGSFSGGLAIFRFQEKVGYINKDGRIQIEPRFEESWWNKQSFQDGLALAKLGDKFGFIDNSGKFVVEPTYEEANPFSDGMALVKIGKEYGFLERDTLSLDPARYDDAASFSEGLAAVKVGESWHFINPRLETAIPGPYWGVDSFSDGVAWAKKPSDTSGLFIDRTGQPVLTDWPGLRHDFHEGLNFTRVGFGYKTRKVQFLSYRGQTKKWMPGHMVYLNKRGELAFPYAFDDPSNPHVRVNCDGDFHEGLAKQVVVDARSGRIFDWDYQVDLFGFIDKTGKFVIPAQYLYAGNFSGGLAAVKSDEGYSYINKNGQRVTSETFVYAQEFSEGAAAVRRENGKWYLLLEIEPNNSQ